MAAKKRLQELFEKYDVSGDGMLSEQEMHHVFSQLGIRRYQVESLFKLADANQDGVIQVHEFLAWVTDQQPKYSIRKNMNDDGTGTVDVVITNTSEVSGKKFTFTFQKPDNLEFPEGNPAEIVLKPGEQISKTLCKVVGSPWRYAWSLKVRSAPTDADDVLTNAFVDPDFPHEDGSIGKASCMRIDTAAKWVRARMLGDPTEAVLFDQVRPQDVQQGGLGDCWLMSALSCLGQYPQKLKSLFTANHLAEDGKYEVYLYNMETKEWETIVIDEFIPCNVRHGKPQPAFAKPLGEEIWVPLLEKAFAKFCGSYGALDGGSAAWAFQVLTGRTDPVHYERTFSGQFRRRRKSDAGFTAKCPQKSAWCWNSSTPPLSADELFTELQGHIADRHVLGCSIRQGPKTKHANQYGLRLNHVYSLLQMFSEELDDGTAVRLVKLRNPWGYREWNGDWSDYSADGNGSAKWKENPQLCARLDPKRSNDGVFYMSFEDWSSWFNSIYLCPVGDKPIPPEEGEADEHAAGELTDETEMMSLLSC